MTDDLEKHVGKILFFPRGSVFYQVNNIIEIGNEPGECPMLECSNDRVGLFNISFSQGQSPLRANNSTFLLMPAEIWLKMVILPNTPV